PDTNNVSAEAFGRLLRRELDPASALAEAPKHLMIFPQGYLVVRLRTSAERPLTFANREVDPSDRQDSIAVRSHELLDAARDLRSVGVLARGLADPASLVVGPDRINSRAPSRLPSTQAPAAGETYASDQARASGPHANAQAHPRPRWRWNPRHSHHRIPQRN